jgi:hypothetical protein
MHAGKRELTQPKKPFDCRAYQREDLLPGASNLAPPGPSLIEIDLVERDGRHAIAYDRG